jgi:hypothetical protein
MYGPAPHNRPWAGPLLGLGAGLGVVRPAAAVLGALLHTSALEDRAAGASRKTGPAPHNRPGAGPLLWLGAGLGVVRPATAALGALLHTSALEDRAAGVPA